MWDETRPVVGCHAAFLEFDNFDNGVAATAIYSGYDHFNSKEFTFGTIRGFDSPEHAQARKRLRAAGSMEAEAALKRGQRYGGASQPGQAQQRQRAGPGRSSAWVLGGPLIVTFDKGEVRLTPQGLLVYGDEEKWEAPTATDVDGRHGIIDQVYRALVNDRPLAADGHWGKATLEVILAVLESGRERKEVFLSHQTPIRD
jgi:phthalate 4,5-cis-dihydrodiol dehydrogenase